jgi:endonuclease/exonuclease/phosphatase family metal-dependent hydrolase
MEAEPKPKPEVTPPLVTQPEDAQAATSAERPPLRIVSYNVRYFGHQLRGLGSTVGAKRRIARMLTELEPLPDVICLQEVETRSLRSTMFFKEAEAETTQLEAFMERFEQEFQRRNLAFPYEAFYFRAHAYKLGAQPLYTTGLAVIVNLNTVKVAGHNAEDPHHITHHHVARWKDRKQSRICAHLRLSDRDGRPFHVFNTHLSLPTPFTREFWQKKEKMGFGVNQLHEARTLSDFVARHAGDDPFIVCGDFNSPPGSPVYRFLTEEARFVGAQAALGQIDANDPRAFPTAGFMRLRMHLDHLFSRGVAWRDLEETCRLDDPKSKFCGLSDHMPLIGRFSLE